MTERIQTLIWSGKTVLACRFKHFWFSGRARIHQSDVCDWRIRGCTLSSKPALEWWYVSPQPSAFQSCFARARTCKSKLSVPLPRTDDTSQSVSLTPAWSKYYLIRGDHQRIRECKGFIRGNKTSSGLHPGCSDSRHCGNHFKSTRLKSQTWDLSLGLDCCKTWLTCDFAAKTTKTNADFKFKL